MLIPVPSNSRYGPGVLVMKRLTLLWTYVMSNICLIHMLIALCRYPMQSAVVSIVGYVPGEELSVQYLSPGLAAAVS